MVCAVQSNRRMTKKPAKSLRLDRETVRNLSTTELERIAGGASGRRSCPDTSCHKDCGPIVVGG
jgi:hypothetical protein